MPLYRRKLTAKPNPCGVPRYFTRYKNLTVENLKPKDIQAFYDYLFKEGVVANTVIHYHALLRRAFHIAFKDEMIDANPFDRIDRPKKNKFNNDNYTEKELLTLLELTKDDVIYPAIMLGGGMGLRRSEALGVRWSRINWEERSVLLDTKIVEYTENGKVVTVPEEQMKNKSSRRTLPLPEPVYEMLIEVKEKQELYRKLFKSSYNRKYHDYVCVDQLGNLIKPSYITSHFSDLLKKYGLRHIRFHDLRHKKELIIYASSPEKVSNPTGEKYKVLIKTFKAKRSREIENEKRREKRRLARIEKGY